jgi:hypothetical protein
MTHDGMQAGTMPAYKFVCHSWAGLAFPKASPLFSLEVEQIV